MEDCLSEFTKKELIAWIREYCGVHVPHRSDLLFIRWKIKSKEWERKTTEHSNRLDSYIAEKNQRDTKNISEKKRLEIYFEDHKKWSKLQAEGRKIDAEWRQNEKLMDSIDKAREQEKKASHD